MICKNSEKCYQRIGCLIDLCGYLLIFWALAYTVNSGVKVFSGWSLYTGFFLFKLFMYRLGIAAAAATAGALAVHLKKALSAGN